ncbi:hypothetical protein M758_7G173400 [Ceratodon purpureus]|uniref:Secreted protein n=1 Tax=Ceratodon purpureus TaxID=3225 RepID=A0A8T0HAR4_CERPU|nr:hypothetical protein KC19_7G176400 [Ceratodon purpureus]KAG0611889.1 hypothetical protein M758_7G173400 [Ceratodon purpureus]
MCFFPFLFSHQGLRIKFELFSLFCWTCALAHESVFHFQFSFFVTKGGPHIGFLGLLVARDCV